MVRLDILGPPRLVDPRSERPLPCWRSQLALLARLALAPTGLPREHLAALVWPGSPAEAARRSLRQALFQLRKHAGDLVCQDRDRLSLSSQVVTDVRQFELLLDEGRCTEALEHYRGELLQSLDPPDGTPFEAWLSEERTRLERLAGRALDGVLEEARREGAWGPGIRSAERWLATGRLSEAAYGFLIRAFAHGGDRARALATFHELRTRLRDELDAAVDPSIEALADRVRHATLAPNGPRPEGANSPVALLDPPFVGRRREFARLSAEWDAARAGHRRFLLITGEAGGGKTRLVSEFARWVRLSDATALVGRSYEMERNIPYGMLTTLLREALDQPGLAGSDPHLLAELTSLVPELAQRFPTAAKGGRVRSGQYRFHEATRAVFDNLACEQPLLIVVDDLPWSDEASMAAIHYAWRTLPAASLLLLATARSDQVGPGSSTHTLLASLVREEAAAASGIDLHPLDATAVAELARVVGTGPTGDAEADSAALAQDTGGNPLLVIETLRARLSGSPPTCSVSLRTLAFHRMGGLSGEARELLQAAAVLGRRVTLPVARAVAGLDARQAAVAAGELVARDLLRRSRYHYDFTHEILRQVLYEELPPEVRILLHEQAYRQSLADTPAESTRLDETTSLARHAGQAGLRVEAYRWALRSAELAERLYAGGEAEEYLRHALMFADSKASVREVWKRLGDLWRVRSRFGDAAVAYLRALSPEAGGGLSVRLRMLDAALRARLVALPQVRRELGGLIRAAARAGPALRRDALVLAAEAVWRQVDPTAALAYAGKAVAAARQAGEPAALVRTLLLHARLLVLDGQSTPVLPAIEEAGRVARGADLWLEWMQAEIERGLELYRLGRWKEAEQTWRRTLGEAERESEFGSLAVVSLNLGDLYLRRGEWRAAEEAFDHVERLCARFDFPHVRAELCANRALLAWHRGDLTATAAHAHAAIVRASAHGLGAAERSARALLALTRLESDDRAEAEAEARAIDHLSRENHSTWADDGELATIVRARLMDLQGNRTAAAALLRRGVAAAHDRYARLLLEVERSALVTDRPRRRARAASLLPALRRLGARPLIDRAERLFRGAVDASFGESGHGASSGRSA